MCINLLSASKVCDERESNPLTISSHSCFPDSDITFSTIVCRV